MAAHHLYHRHYYRLHLLLLAQCFNLNAPRGAGAPLFPLVPSLLRLLFFFTFPFLSGFNYFLLLSILLLSTE